MIEIKNLCKSFGGNVVLRNINITLKDGGIYCLMGESGIGKTTLLKIIAGLCKPTGGEIYGVDRQSIAFMFQENRLIEYLSPIDNISIISKKRNVREQIRRELNMLLPGECLEKPVSELSGGMKRRVALVRTIWYQKENASDLIILDEPFSGLDDNTKNMAGRYILGNCKNKIIIIVTHDREDADFLKADIIKI